MKGGCGGRGGDGGDGHAALFAATPSTYLVLAPDLVIVEVNQAHLEATNRTRDDLIVLVHPDGTCDLLDQATDPPLGARPQHVPRPQAGQTYSPGDTLVLYTDGLIERRGEHLETGLNRLTDALSHYRGLDPERLSDALLAQLGVAGGARDDIALVVVRL